MLLQYAKFWPWKKNQKQSIIGKIKLSPLWTNFCAHAHALAIVYFDRINACSRNQNVASFARTANWFGHQGQILRKGNILASVTKSKCFLCKS